MVSRVTFLVLLLSLLCIQSEGGRRNLQLETATSAGGDNKKASQDVQGSGNMSSSSLSAIFHPQIGDFLSSYSAVYQAGNGAYLGGGGRFDTHGFPNLTGYEIITTAVWLVGANNGMVEVIQAGWHVYPALYGDSKTRFFTGWTADGYDFCYNTGCEGFVKIDTAPISPGDVLPISTSDENHELIIWIEKDHTGDWWLYASTDSTSSGQVGYWPKSLFSKLAESANVVNYGGFVQVKKGSVSPPMGSGHFPKDMGSAAFFANVEYTDEFGRKIAGNLPSIVTKKDCYDVGDLDGARFLYGGPGGCVS